MIPAAQATFRDGSVASSASARSESRFRPSSFTREFVRVNIIDRPHVSQSMGGRESTLLRLVFVHDATVGRETAYWLTNLCQFQGL